MNDMLQAAVLVENHPYDVVGFQKMLDSFQDCKCYVQPVDLFVRDDDNRKHYDTVLWYNINWDPPAENSVLRNYLENEAGASGQGIVLIHHALLNFQNWSIYTELCGLRERGAGIDFKYFPNQIVHEHILDGSHPITGGLADFTLTDETYNIGEPEEPGNHILIGTDNPTSMKSLAWTRQYRNSRVFACASGHDNRVYADENYRRVIHRALLWTSGRI
ncbi:MAG: ThuA domain-containing protein [Treponema sp.]|jgi:trehalose utilization protein|nr:ThuA domain-containing protein [Treponema sp.]